MSGGLIERFAEVLTAVGGRAHGPMAVDEALDLLVTLCRERAGTGVAVSTGDPVMHKLGVAERLAAAGLDVLRPDDVFWRERLAEALHRAQPLPDGAQLPSNLVWVSGPSRSADLELVLTVGVHGPGSVDVIVVEGNNG